MTAHLSRFASIACLLVAPLASTGCAMFESRSMATRCYPLDAGSYAELSAAGASSAVSDEARKNYWRLDLLVRQSSGDRAVQGGVVCERSGSNPRRPCAVMPSEMDEIELRADDHANQLWLVDHGLGRVIATLDRTTNAFTGIDDPIPVWATPDGGHAIRPSEQPAKGEPSKCLAEAAPDDRRG